MNRRTSNWARLGVLAVATLMPAMLAAQMQNQSDVVPGTGMTMAELRDIGFTQEQIAEIRNTDLDMSAGGASGAMDRAEGTADRAQSAVTESAPVQSAQDTAQAATDGGSNWGWLGIFGLLGLLGLRGGKRAAAHDERDIRRVA